MSAPAERSGWSYPGYRRKKATRRRRRRKGKYSTSTSKLADKRINTLVEKRMQEISKAEAKKLISPNLLFRRYCFADYNMVLNEFTNPTVLDRRGAVLHMCQIPIWDIQTMLTVPPTADVQLRPPIPVYQRGVNVLAAGRPQDGFRTSSDIYLKNLGASLRFSIAGADATGPGFPDKDYVQCEYQIIAVNSPLASGLGWTPAMRELIPLKGFGYSSRLDFGIKDPHQDLQQKILARGSCKVFQKETGFQEVYKKLYWEGNMPYEYQAADATVPQTLDQNGQQVTGKWKVFLAVRSDQRETAANDFKVKLAGVIKCGYRNVT